MTSGGAINLVIVNSAAPPCMDGQSSNGDRIVVISGKLNAMNE